MFHGIIRKIIISALFLSLSLPLYAATDIYPTDSFTNAVANLKPGDTLVVHEGTYKEISRTSITVKGTSSLPVVIKGADGEARPIITRADGAQAQNTINIEGATYLTVKNLEITNPISAAGVTFAKNPSYITLDNLVIHDIDLGIHVSDTSNNITIKNCRIFNTGKDGGTGEGMYIGCNNSTCRVTNSVFENNWIHDTLQGTSQGDGIEIKVGSHSNVIRNNVIYNRPYPCIFSYGNAGQAGVNTVEGNVVWNCAYGIAALADTIVRNNIVLDSSSGIHSIPHAQVSTMKDVTIVNNTLFNNDDGMYLRWNTVSNMVLANNAVYSPNKNSINAQIGASGITIASNYTEGNSTATIDNLKFFSGGSYGNAFVDANNKDFWPKSGSPLIGKANASYVPQTDFNGTLRTTLYDVGAYESEGLSSNPGWKIVPGFKGIYKDTIAPKAPTGLRKAN